ncbi:signal recognition particle-docking protein FtsY [bacterium]|nr:signal recognition particle-docking protein FtsY [bacterium]
MLTTDQSDRIKRKLELGQLYHDLGLYDEGVQTLKEVTTEFPETDEGQHAIADMKKLRTELEGSALDDVVTISHKKRLLEDLSEKIGEKSLFERLHQGLQKTRDSFVSKLEKVLNQGAISDDVFDEVEETLILADVGFETTNLIMTRLRKAYKEKSITSAVEIKPFLIAEISTILSKYQGTLSIPAEPPLVIMMIGVNGVGKTTTIAKLAYMFQQEGRSVLLAAADTFRAGAIEQISEWGNRLNTDVVKHTSGSDPSAVAYDAIHAAKARSKDVLIIDTAGRLHTKVNLMEELKKIRRIIGRELGRTPDETLLVLDATNGQNAISQAKIFKQDLDVSGIILTKLDGTAKGGIIISIANELDIPVKFIGVGEKMYDLRPFHAQEFLEALFGLEH